MLNNLTLEHGTNTNYIKSNTNAANLHITCNHGQGQRYRGA